MITTWITSYDLNTLATYCQSFSNFLSPVKGRPAIEASPEGDPPVEFQAAQGDPSQWYACVRSEEALELPSGINQIAEEEGSPLLGVWA